VRFVAPIALAPARATKRTPEARNVDQTEHGRAMATKRTPEARNVDHTEHGRAMATKRTPEVRNVDHTERGRAMSTKRTHPRHPLNAAVAVRRRRRTHPRHPSMPQSPFAGTTTRPKSNGIRRTAR
jgi:hypothetical protein